MLGGLIIQVFEDRFDKHRLIDLGLIRRIQNTALDFLVVAAIATIRIDMLKAFAVPFLIVVAAGILWNVFCVVVLARRLLPNAWFERAIAEMGQSMGVTATGLLLLRVVDPDYESPAVDAFASKQLLHEPFMGGGLWTSAAVPLLCTVGAPVVFLIATGAVVVWLVVLLAGRAMSGAGHRRTGT
jgi:ESS family glutamate:Na+ symporter